MTVIDAIDKDLIAPCGMNCRLCMAYQRKRNHCDGCRNDNGLKPNQCKVCIIKNCTTIQTNLSGFCFECNSFPCHRLKQLDKRYREKYHMSMLENLEFIKSDGMTAFLEKEKERWTCEKCGNIICVHRDLCPTCNEPKKYE
jgi:hypothetical protein